MTITGKIVLSGTLVKDPDLRFTAGGVPVAALILTTTEPYRDKSGEQQEKTRAHTIFAWRDLAELAHEHLHKNSNVRVEGCLRTRVYEDKRSKQKHTLREIIACRFELLDGRRFTQVQQQGHMREAG